MAFNALIGALRVVLGLDSGEFETGLKRSEGKLGAFGKAASAGLAIAATAVAGAGAVIAAGVKSAIDAADELNKASQKVGVSVEALSRLKYAGDLADVSLEQLTGGFKKLSANMASAARGAGPAAGAFQALDISVTDANGKLRDGDAVFADVAEAFSRMENGAGKTALAVAIFGKSGADLIPLLNSGKSGLAEMAAEAEALGVTIDSRTAQAAENFNDNLTRLQTVGTGLTTQLSAALAPTLASISAAFVGVAKNGAVMHGVGVLLGGTLKVLASAAVVVAQAFSNMGTFIASAAKAIVLVFRGDFAGAVDAFKAGIVQNIKGLGTAAIAVRDIWIGTGAQVAGVTPQVSDQIAAPLVEGANKASAARKALESEAQKAARALGDFVAAEEKRLAERSLDANQIKIRELQARAQEAINLGLEAEYQRILLLIDAYRQLGIEIVKVDAATVDFVATPRDLSAAIDEMAKNAKPSVEDLADAFHAAGNAVDDVFYGVRNNDWVGAFGGLVRGLGQVRDAFAQAGNSAGQFAAIAGLANGVGQAIGGTAGATISGAASGALTGFTVAGPVGALVGGILGGLGGLFGSSKAKKKAKKEAAERARLEAERKAAEEAAQKRELEIAVLEASGKAVEAAAEREKDYLASLSPANRALGEQLIALRKETEAREAAAELARITRDLEVERLEAIGDAAGAMKLFREDELAALPEALRPAKQAIYDYLDAQAALTAAQQHYADIQSELDGRAADAREALADAAAEEAERLEDVADRFGDLADALAEARGQLLKDALGGGAQSAALARGAFQRIAAAARAGDEQALADLPDAVRAFVDAETARATTQSQVDAAIRQGAAALKGAEGVARVRVSDAQRQLDELHLQTDHLVGIEAKVSTIGGLIDALNAAVYEQTTFAKVSASALDALRVELPGAIASLSAALNDNLNLDGMATGGIDASAVTAALDSSTGGLNGTDLSGAGGADLAKAVAEAMTKSPEFTKLVDAAVATARSLDDATQGGDSLRTTTVAA